MSIKSPKLIYDNIHGHIKLSPYAVTIIDTPEFQRLRELRQLGSCYMVFPSATHDRFQHSIGVYYLTGYMLENVRKNSDPKELKDALLKIRELSHFEGNFTDYVIELVKIAALCHDIGHMAFSHVFDDIFLSNYSIDTPMKEHENRSCYLLEYIIKKTGLKILPQEIKFIQNLINPRKEHTGFIYQIVSNNVNAIDVDKFDYVVRDTYMLNIKFGFDYMWALQEAEVIDDKICYPKQLVHELHNLFTIRHKLHKQFYSHKAVISTQYMISDILKLLNKTLGISDSITDPEKFCKITDQNIMCYLSFVVSDDPEVKEAKKLLDRIKTRHLYKHIGTMISDKESVISYQKFQEINPLINETDIIIHKSKIGYVSGNKKNPLNNLFFFDKKKETKICFTIDPHEVTMFIPTNYQEQLLMIFCRNLDKVEIVKEAFEKIKNLKN